MLNKIIQKLLVAINDKPLPSADNKELELINELRASFKAINFPEDKTGNISEMQWFQNMKRLKELVLTGDPREFLRWDVIKKTMFVASAHYIPVELNYLKERVNWSAKWEPVIIENQVGHPPPYAFYTKSSGNLIHQAYHLAVYEEEIKQDIIDVDLVVEFGGGYGGMARLFSNLGFKGKYIIFDLEPFSLLQDYYLKSINVPILTIANYRTAENGVLLLSDIKQLESVLEDADVSRSMFLATWSISESPMHVRDSFVPLVSKFGSYLVAYQDSFGEVNNVDFFNEWKKGRSDINWVNFPIVQLSGSRYLMGKLA